MIFVQMNNIKNNGEKKKYSIVVNVLKEVCLCFLQVETPIKQKR